VVFVTTDSCEETASNRSKKVSGVVYSEVKQLLYIRYQDNSLYLFKGVPNFEYEELKRTSSFQCYIGVLKQIHSFERIE
jgi:hypothetical protein